MNKSRIFIFILCFIIVKHLSSDSIFYFEPPHKGIFLIDSSYISNDFIVYNNQYVYNSYYNFVNNKAFVYAGNPEKHYLVHRNDDIIRCFMDWDINISSEDQNLYVHDMISLNSESNWIKAILQPNSQDLYMEFDIKNLDINYNNSINLFLYNFSSERNDFVLNLNNKTFNTSILNRGDTIINLNVSSFIHSNYIKDDKLKIKISDSKFDLGVVKVVPDFYYNSNYCINSNELRKEFNKSNLTIISPNSVIDCLKGNKIFYIDNNNLCLIKDSNDFNLETSKFYAVRENSIKTLNLKIDVINGSLMSSECNYLVIYNPEFAVSIEALIEYFTIHRIDICCLNVEEIYAMYPDCNGKLSKIKKCINNIKPKRLLLIGDSNMKGDSTDLIPTFCYTHIHTNSIYSSDYGFSYFLDEEKPEIIVSRLPFNKDIELQLFVERMCFNSNRTFNSRKRTKTLLNFEGENNSNLNFFNNIHENLDFLNLKNLGLKSNELNCLIHIGHGSYKGWSEMSLEEILNLQDFQYLDELVDLSCWTGVFSLNGKDCFSEKLLKRNDSNLTSIISPTGFLSDLGSKKILIFFGKSSNLNNLDEILLRLRQEYLKKYPLLIDDLRMLNVIGVGVLE